MAGVKRSPLDDVQLVIKEYLFLQYALIIPVVLILNWLYGFYYTWGSVAVVALGYSMRAVSAKKHRFYRSFSEPVPLSRNKREIQHCAWLNFLILKYWRTCVPKFVEPQIERVNGIMQEKKPGFVKKLEIAHWDLGARAPRITQIYAPIILSENRYELEFEMIFVPDCTVKVEAHPYIPLNICAAEVKFRGRMKLEFEFNDLFPECSIVSFGFVEQPLIEVAVRPTPKFDLLSAPLVYDIAYQITKSNLEPILVYPNKLQFTLGGGQVETYEHMEQPITDIVIIYSETSKAPPGYVLLQRTASGISAANLNSGNSGKQLYICYSRSVEKPPITGVAIIFPEFDKKPPPTFEAILETPAAEPASLNIGNEGTEAFLCVSRAEGTPITGLTLVNETEDYILPEDFRILELSPEGHKANINKRAGGDRLFLSYKGGHNSYFGFPKECKNMETGLLRLELVEARDLFAADLGGTSDPFCEVLVGDATPKKGTPTKYTRVIDKTLSPKWEENFIIDVPNRLDSILTINVYDKDAIEIQSELIGRIQLSLANLVLNKEVDQWIPVQLQSTGEVRIKATALTFGLPENEEAKPFEPLVVSKYNSSKLLSGIGGLGIAGIKGVGNLGGMGLKGVTNVGEMGLKGVTNVGEMGLKGVTNVGELGLKGVTNVGELGLKGVTNVGAGVSNAVGGLFGKKKKDKEKKLPNIEVTPGDDVPKPEEPEHHEHSESLLSSGMTHIGSVFKSKKKHEKTPEKSEKTEKSERSERRRSGLFGLRRSHSGNDDDKNIPVPSKDKIEPSNEATLIETPVVHEDAAVEVPPEVMKKEAENTSITREGVLEKHSHKLTKSLLGGSHKRFCLLKPDSLLVYKSKKGLNEGKKPETIPLSGAKVTQSKDTSSFELHAAGTDAVTFKATSPDDCQLWLSAINNNVQLLSKQ